MFLAKIEPQVPMGGESLVLLLGGLFTSACLLAVAGTFVLNVLRIIAFYASITVLVFLRKGIGVRAMRATDFLIAVLFLYFVGNMVGHNYHDMYRDVGATRWAAQVHFTYLALFVVMGSYRKVEAWQQEKTMKPDSRGSPSALAQRLPTHSLAPQSGFYAAVMMEPLAVILLGLLLGVVLRNWFGWYLVLTGCLMFYWLLWIYYEQREADLDAREGRSPESPAP